MCVHIPHNAIQIFLEYLYRSITVETCLWTQKGKQLSDTPTDMTQLGHPKSLGIIQAKSKLHFNQREHESSTFKMLSTEQYPIVMEETNWYLLVGTFC